MTTLSPSTAESLADAIRSTPRVLVIGARTKPRLSEVTGEVVLLSTRRLSGIIEYDPSEFTFTALAGTTVREITAALAERGQYLPFDPPLVESGATIGGTVAAGLSGPGRFRYGGLRDFILGVRFVDGEGRLLRMGGKVVKNAAGFDLPKFFVGSLGRFGVLAEVTFKVFPRAAATRTLRLTLDSLEDAVRVLTEAANTRWEPDALDLPPDGRSVLLRLAGPEAALEALSREVLLRWPGTILSNEEADALWTDVREFHWAHPDGTLIKVALTSTQVPALHRALGAIEGSRIHASAGGDVAFVSLPGANIIDNILRDLGLAGLTLRGAGPLFSGVQNERKITRSVKAALDPQNRFPSLDDE